jgi:hypothetical protein
MRPYGFPVAIGFGSIPLDSAPIQPDGVSLLHTPDLKGALVFPTSELLLHAIDEGPVPINDAVRARMQSINATFQYGNRLIMAAWFKRYFSHGCNAPFTVVQSDVIPLLQSSPLPASITRNANNQERLTPCSLIPISSPSETHQAANAWPLLSNT